MDRREQILEMSKVIKSVRPMDGCNMSFKCKYNFKAEISCSECSIANALIEAGYGNVEQAVKEFAEKTDEVPCKVGIPLFELFIYYPDISMWRVQEGKCTMLQQKADKSWKVRFSYGRGDCHDITSDNFGKTIFTDKIEAEAMLEKLKERKVNE